LVHTDTFYADHPSIAQKLQLIDFFLSKEKVINLYRENIQKDIKF